MARKKDTPQQTTKDTPRSPKPKDAPSVQRRLLDLQASAGNAAVTTAVQRHSLDPENMGEDASS